MKIEVTNRDFEHGHSIIVSEIPSEALEDVILAVWSAVALLV